MKNGNINKFAAVIATESVGGLERSWENYVRASAKFS